MILNFHMHSGNVVSIRGVKDYTITTKSSPGPITEFEITYKDGVTLGREPVALISTIDLTRVEAVTLLAEADEEK